MRSSARLDDSWAGLICDGSGVGRAATVVAGISTRCSARSRRSSVFSRFKRWHSARAFSSSDCCFECTVLPCRVLYGQLSAGDSRDRLDPPHKETYPRLAGRVWRQVSRQRIDESWIAPKRSPLVGQIFP